MLMVCVWFYLMLIIFCGYVVVDCLCGYVIVDETQLKLVDGFLWMNVCEYSMDE